jgi:hypothetical protein
VAVAGDIVAAHALVGSRSAADMASDSASIPAGAARFRR